MVSFINPLLQEDIPRVEYHWPAQIVQCVVEPPEHIVPRQPGPYKREFLQIRLPLIHHPAFCVTLLCHISRTFLLVALLGRARRSFRRSNLRDWRLLAHVVRLFHEEKQEDNCKGAENAGPVEHPLPALVLGDEAADDWCKVVAACQEECI